MDQIKEEMGPDALIISNKKIRVGGIFKFFKKPVIEIVAAADEPPKNLAGDAKTAPSADVAELKEMVQELLDKFSKLESAQPAAGQTEIKETQKSIEEIYIDYLLAAGVQKSIAKKIVEIVGRQISLARENHDIVVNAMKLVAREYLGDIASIDKDSAVDTNIYVFLGPTGVGKTTTLSKIAGNLIAERKTVAIITLDTYRMAAKEQIKSYCNIMNIPNDVAYYGSQLLELIEKYRNYEYILIDTAGRSHKSSELRSDYDETVRHIPNAKLFLLLSVSTEFNELRNITSAYSFLSSYRLLFTKLDEADSFSDILNVKILTGMPLSYFAVGQSVPNDILVADRDMVVDNIFAQFQIAEEDDGSSSET